MEFLKIGKIVNTHGIKGELRILSDFEYKDKVFKNNVSLYVGSLKKEYVINSYRHHKIFEMVTFKGYNNINEVLELKGQLVYVNRSILKINEDDYLLNDLIGMEVFDNDELLIKDSGIGIAKEDLPRIFDRGYTGYNGRKDKKATGLGLYLTKQILDRLNHKIEIDSQIGVGTRVFIKF